MVTEANPDGSTNISVNSVSMVTVVGRCMHAVLNEDMLVLDRLCECNFAEPICDSEHY